MSASDPTVDSTLTAPYHGEYVGTIEVIVLRCFPSDGFALPIRGEGKTSIKREAEEDDASSFMGAIFDGANDAKPRLFNITGSSGAPTSSMDRRSRKKPKPEKIEIHNSNVHIYKTSQKDNESSKHGPRRRHSKHYPDSAYGFSSSHPTSPRTHIAAYQARSSYNRTYSGTSASPALHLRGGAPGSYTASPTEDKPSSNVWDAAPGVFPEGGTGWNSDAMPLAEETGNDDAKEDGGWQNDSGNHWWSDDAQTEIKPWDPVTNPTEKTGEWDENIQESESSNPGGNVGWDPVTNPSEKRDVWGNIITGDGGESNDISRAAAWISYADNVGNIGGDWNADSGGSGNGWDANDAHQGDHNEQRAEAWESTAGQEAKKDATDSSNWNNTMSGGDQNEASESTKIDSVEVTMGASIPAKPSLKDPLEHAKAKEKPQKPSIISKGKNAKAGSVASSTGLAKLKKDPPVSILKTSAKRPNANAKSPMPIVSADETPMAMPGSWGSSSIPSKTKERSTPKQQTPPLPTSQVHALPIYSTAKPPSSRPYWATWNNATTPAPTSPVLTEFSNDNVILTPEEEPVYTIPSTLASQHNLTHQVRPMRGSAYSHRLSSPKYMDTHDDPYAVFVFKYRDQAVIEQMLGRKVETTEEEEKQRLKGLSKEEIIEELLKARAGIGHVVAIPAVSPTAPANGAMSTEREPGTDRSVPRGKVVPGPSPEENESGAWNGDIGVWGKNPKGAGAWKSSESGKATAKTGGGSNNQGENGWNSNREKDGDIGGSGNNDNWGSNDNNGFIGDGWKDDQGGTHGGEWGNNSKKSGNGGSNGWGNDQNGGTDGGDGGGW